MKKLHIADDEEFVEGRSQEKAAELLELAKELGLERRVRTTTNGYLVPKAIFDGGGKHAAEETAEETAEAAAANQPATFDPNENNVEDVLAYLDTADDDERTRVLAAEKDGKARKTILASDEEGDK